MPKPQTGNSSLADPEQVIAEILGQPAGEMRSPANAEYLCPFIDGTCTKVSHYTTDPYPVCSIFRGKQGTTGLPVCICPKRFFEASIKDDVLKHCWSGPAPTNPRLVHEIQMEKFGKVDFVVADYDAARGKIKQFVSVELQAVDITGSVLPAYEAITNSKPIRGKMTYGFNWANVRKRFVSQLVAKGFYHHHWGTRIVAALQTDLFDEFQKHAQVAAVPIQQSNIVFLLYQFKRPKTEWSLRLEKVVPTNHMMVMNAILYENPPSKDEFTRRIVERISHGG